jgi:hypothetical protein
MDEEPDVTAHIATPASERLAVIEEAQRNVIRRVEGLEDELRAMKRAFYTWCLSIIAAAIAVVFAVFELLGRGG